MQLPAKNSRESRPWKSCLAKAWNPGCIEFRLLVTSQAAMYNAQPRGCPRFLPDLASPLFDNEGGVCTKYEFSLTAIWDFKFPCQEMQRAQGWPDDLLWCGAWNRLQQRS